LSGKEAAVKKIMGEQVEVSERCVFEMELPRIVSVETPETPLIRCARLSAALGFSLRSAFRCARLSAALGFPLR